MFIKLLVYFYAMIQLLINRILMVLITYFMFEAQINYMWVKCYMLLLFTLHEVPIFPFFFLHHTMHLLQIASSV
jgi:hypothetical protein